MPSVASPQEEPTDSLQTSVGVTVRRSRPIYRVFVSSTWIDLQPERRALMEALNRMEEMRFVGMEFFGNRPDDTHDASIDQVDLCEVLVAIIGHRYGSGITAAEYRRARTLNLPCFVYFKRAEAVGPDQTDNDPALAAHLEAFKKELLRGHTVKDFDRPEELAANATADLHNWVAARWISLEQETIAVRPRAAPPDADRTNVLRLIERIDQDWIKGVLEASLHHRAWLELGLDWREDAVEHPWDRIVVAPNRPIQTLSKKDSITSVFDAAQHTLLVLGEPGAGKTTTVLELARDLITRTREAVHEPAPVVLALSTWRGQHKDLLNWLVVELGLRYQVPKKVARTWLEEGRLVLILDGLDEVVVARRAACVDAINAFEQAHPPAGLAVTCRVAEYDALTTKLRLRSAICLQPLTPAQVDRYFQSAGPGLAPLRQALQEDTGLRELARSPLMLSVMTMAWREAPAGTTAPFAAAQTQEELRRKLFDAYVQAALNRRGKTTGGYPPEQTTRWLTWLAQRMKEHGHTLFALEQLQPGWLEGTWRQFGYYIGSRLLGTLGLALPFLFFPQPKGGGSVAIALPALGLLAGCYLGVIDFAIARHGWGGHRSAELRLWSTLLGLMFLTFGWLGLSPNGPLEVVGTLYLFMVGLAFCAPVDVRALDIKPAGSIQWSSQLAASRTVGLVGILTIILVVIRLLAVQSSVSGHGWGQGWITLGRWFWVAGLALSGGLVLVAGPMFRRWPKLRQPGIQESRFLKITCVLLGGQLGAVLDMTISAANVTGARAYDAATFANGATFVAIIPTVLFWVFGGFGSTLIDPARPQQAGPWFWLRVPVLAFLMVGGVAFVPVAMISVGATYNTSMGEALGSLGGVALFSAGCGLVAFLRFGGFNGAQHFLLRWLLARSGHLPARAEPFLRHAAQLALLQKVGLGYRFVHGLLLQHLATPVGVAGVPAAPEAATADSDRQDERSQSRLAGVLHLVARLGLSAGLLLLVSLGASGFVFKQALTVKDTSDVMAPLLGAMMLVISLAIPLFLITGRWLGRRMNKWWLGAGWLGFGLMLVYLANDEPTASHPPNLTLAPAVFPGAKQSDAVLIRYNFNGYGPRAFRWTGSNFHLDPEKRLSWTEFARNRRAVVADNWQKLEPVRAWIGELNAFEQIADLRRDLSSVRVIDYQVLRPLLINTMAYASMQALDGQGDAALATLQPLLEVGGKLEEGARGLIYWRKAREMQEAAMKGAEFVLDSSAVSGAARERFAAALAARGGGANGARRPYVIRLARMEYATDSFGRVILAGNERMFNLLEPGLNLIGPVAFNRQASRNRWSELFGDLAELAVRRQPDQAQRRAEDFLDLESRVRLKNHGHAWLVCFTTKLLGLKTVGEEQTKYWKLEDRRTALLAKLRAP